MALHKSFIIIIFSLFYCTAEAINKCKINLSVDVLTRPDIRLNFGRKQIFIPSHINNIEIKEGDQVSAYCNNEFENPLQEAKYINLECSRNGLFCRHCLMNSNNDEDRYYYREDTFKIIEGQLRCNLPTSLWHLYEIRPSFAFCLSHETSYGVGKRKFNSTNFIVGICYNIEQMKLGSVFHTMGTTKEFTHKLFENYTISAELENGLQYFTSERFVSKDDALRNQINVFGEYENDLLIVNHNTKGNIEHFGSLLHIPWWRNLRLGNWHKYQKVLIERSKIYEYKMITGTTEILEIPIEYGCYHNITMKLSKDHIPMYVWNYIEWDTEAQEKYIIVGINSPFYEFHHENDLIFCKDICHEIDWLKDVAKTFRYSIMGIVFCCTVDDAITSNRLNGFPKDLKIYDLDMIHNTGLINNLYTRRATQNIEN